jgi:dipeptidyl aminopeptidase/acylaminoacyl peptidase
MLKKILVIVLFIFPSVIFCQEKLQPLTVEKIMRDPKWMGTSPSNPYWSEDGKYLLFNWNPEKAQSDSLYYITLNNHHPVKTTAAFRNTVGRFAAAQFNGARTMMVYADGGDIYLEDLKTGNKKKIIQTAETEANPQFSFNDSRVVYTSGSNLFSWEINSGQLTQLTNFQSAAPTTTTPPTRGFAGRAGGQGTTNPRNSDNRNAQDEYLKEDALENSEVLNERRSKRELADSMRKLFTPKKLRTINIEDRNVSNIIASPDGRFIAYRLFKPATTGKTTVVPVYVTESGYTEELTGRTKVGSPQGSQELFVFDTKVDTVLPVKIDSVHGIKDLPDYLKDYPKQFEQKLKNPAVRSVSFTGPYWSPKGTYAVVDMRAQDNKDRWLMLLDPNTGKLKLLDQQHDAAWIGGPGVFSFGGNNSGWLNESVFWYQSEESGYSHIYTVAVNTGEKKAITSGKYEVQQAQLSADKKYFFITTNEVHPGEQQFYRVPSSGGKAERITTMTGANEVQISPDEKNVAIIYSYSNKPWELYLQQNKPGGKLEQITFDAQSSEFKSYAWKDPEVVTFTARDGATVYARLFKPAQPHPLKPAVVFVHGAGYLQNAHKWWSSYFREYMFNNLLADHGYYVIDIDYRGSAGYGL